MKIYLRGGPRGGKLLDVSERGYNTPTLLYKHPTEEKVAYYRRTEELTDEGHPIFEYEVK